MKFKQYAIPALGGEVQIEEMNNFIDNHRILNVSEQLIQNGNASFWSYCIRYTGEQTAQEREKNKVDYRTVLDKASFERFSAMRVIRKDLAKKEGLPPYAIFNDLELAELARIENLNEQELKNLKGIGEKKVEKYGVFFIPKAAEHEANASEL
jgi:superfamily II DNA helicase RecQ